MKKRMTASERREARAEEDRKTARIREWIAEGQRRAAERALNRPAGLVDDEHTVALLLQTAYGIPEKCAKWLLRESPYRPPEAEGCDVPLPGDPTRTFRVVTAWREDDIHAAARKFVGECQHVTPTLWVHPRITGRFRLRAAGVESAGQRRDEVA
jgi:hypothetical protein